MCGIAAICNLDGAPVALPLLERMTDAIAHRGPDGEGHYADAGVGLGHRRLAIIDLSSAGRQPMSNETGDVVITYNGEIYNFQTLRVQLEAAGHRFHSQTDSEVVVHAYEEWGEAAVHRFNGMFAFILWDGRARRLFAARDRFGVKPLYYAWSGGRLVMASEIKAILTHPDVPRRVSYDALNEYFTFQNILTDATLFDGIRLLPAGCWLSFETTTADGAPRIRPYWDFQFATEPMTISAGDAAEELQRLTTQAVTRQLVSDVPIGSYLSGGMDSGSITAIARRQLGRMSTFTCGFDLSSASGLELAFDERASAEVLANLLKTEHYEVVLHAGDMEHVMPELIWHLEDLRVGQCYPNYSVARLASKFVKVVLSGAGGDELFAGYPWRYFRGLSSNGRHDFHQNYYDFWQRLVKDEEKPRLFTPEAWKRMDAGSTQRVFRSILDAGHIEAPDRPETFVNASLYFELKTFLHGLLLVEDKVSMAHSLETRVPFLDNDLVDFALRLPLHLKLRHVDQPAQRMDENELAKRRRYQMQSGDGKVVLREAMSRIIPPAVTERVKQGFSAPDASWFRGDSIDYINGLLGDRHARVHDFLSPAFIAAKLEDHTAGHRNHRLLIWSLLSFEWWLRRYFG